MSKPISKVGLEGATGRKDLMYTGDAGLLNFNRAALITMESWYSIQHGSPWEQNSIFAAV